MQLKNQLMFHLPVGPVVVDKVLETISVVVLSVFPVVIASVVTVLVVVDTGDVDDTEMLETFH